MKTYEYDVEMRKDDVFAFLMRQQFFGMKGIVNVVLNVIVILCLVLKWKDYDLTAKLLLILILAMLWIYTPINLFMRARSQAADSQKTHYALSDKGIMLSRNGESMELLWGHFQKCSITSKRIYVFTSKYTAFIFPKNQLGSEASDYLIKCLKENKDEFGTKSLSTARCFNADGEILDEKKK